MLRMVALISQGLTNKQICERLGAKPNTVRVLKWRLSNLEKHKQNCKNYYIKNKKRCNERTKNWIALNPDLHKEYQFRTKCNKAGVDWRIEHAHG